MSDCVLVPTAPQNLRVINASESSLYVTWSRPQPINGVIQQYRLIYWTTTAGNTSSVISVSASVNAYNITALSAATNYSIQVSYIGSMM